MKARRRRPLPQIHVTDDGWDAILVALGFVAILFIFFVLPDGR